MDVIVAEYSQLKKKVYDIAFNLPGNKLKGTFTWEPLNWSEAVFDRNGHSNAYLDSFSVISKENGIRNR